MSTGRIYLQYRMKEALNIKTLNPTLNQNLFQRKSFFWINVLKQLYHYVIIGKKWNLVLL